MREHIEARTGALFGELWKNLDDDQYRSSVELFTKRAVANNFDLDWLKGKRCLDAGCGSGRYSVAMAQHGAGEIVAVDISKTGLSEARRRTADFPSISFQQASVLDLPFDDASFDFVWSAGVIHHTPDMGRCLDELTRVLRPGGKLFLLVYGFGGLRWTAIKSLRPVCRLLGQSFLQEAITVAGLPANNRKHFMDDLFVPIQTLTEWDSLYSDLKQRGYEMITRWEGETFDHESDSTAQSVDLAKLVGIGESAKDIAKTSSERCASNLFRDIAKLYFDVCEKVRSDTSIPAIDIRSIVIGEGNHRVIAEKL